ncbi:MAG: iron-sulfur cluster repair di-iron protein [Armatimonadota bacterium]
MAEFDISPEMTVGAVVAEYPATMRMLEALGIDYCCGGNVPLTEASKRANVPVETVVAVLRTAIAQAQQSPAVERNWQQAPLDELMDHIVRTHHTFMHAELPRIGEMLEKVTRAHGAAHGPMLEQLSEVYQTLRAEIQEHLAKEEDVTFPAIRLLLTGQYDERVQRTVRELEHEHEVAGAALARMREITRDYALPGDACTTFVGLFTALQDLERDLHQHIHLENNILFPRVRQLAASQGKAA